ncbi:MAG: Ezrin/radixin/moesin family protein [Cyclobacteriaceae bacterium]|nr:Ezrin/radixin/moesin family protein [Cyclobacteriaceae bacterium]
MKHLSLALLVIVLAFISFESHAQLGKKEKKEWKKKAKEYKGNPEALKQLSDDNQALNTQVGNLTSEVESLKSKLSDKDAQIADVQSQLAQAKSDLAAARRQVSTLQAQLAAKPAAQPMEGVSRMVDGVVFRVQIGAFRNKDLSKYFEASENFKGDVDEDGTQKYTLGQFRDYWEADTFKKYLREMGVKDAWIVPYKDGARVDIKDVLEGVINESQPGS